MAAPVTRVPWSEKPQVLDRHCTCHFIWSQRADDGRITRHERLWRDPKCKIHGHDARPSPF